jgi:hypothetical protein
VSIPGDDSESIENLDTNDVVVAYRPINTFKVLPHLSFCQDSVDLPPTQCCLYICCVGALIIINRFRSYTPCTYQYNDVYLYVANFKAVRRELCTRNQSLTETQIALISRKLGGLFCRKESLQD